MKTEEKKSAKNDVEGISIEEFLESRLKRFIPKFSKMDNGNLYFSVIEEVERSLISLILRETGGNQIKASKILGINRNTLRKKIRDLGIEIEK